MRFACLLIALSPGITSTPLAAQHPDYPLHPAPIENVTVEGGFWGPRITTNAKVTVPHNFKHLEKAGHLPDFDRAAGIDKTPVTGHAANDSNVTKVIEGTAYTLQLRPELIDSAQLATQIERIVAAQQKDGYLCPKFHEVPPAQRWDDLRHSHVLYSAGHLFEAGVAHHHATKDDTLLKSARRYADLIDKEFGPNQITEPPGHQEIELALIKLYRATKEPRYLQLAKFFLDQRGSDDESPHPPYSKPEADDYHQNRVPLTEETRAVGHAVRASYTYAAMCDIAALTGDASYRKAVDRIWNDVVGKKLYLTGGSASAQYHDEGYGEPYHLPNDTAYCETCGTIANVLWSHRMALLHRDATYIDVLERALYNGVLSGIAVSGDQFAYKNPLSNRDKTIRHPSWDPACCQTNLVRTIPQIGTLAWAADDSTAFINLFMESTATLALGSGSIQLTQKTDYPLSGTIHITVDQAPPQPCTIAIRIPGWARNQPVPSDLYTFLNPLTQNPSLSVNGQEVELSAKRLDRGYLHISRQWAAGDTIELELPMPVKRVIAHEKVEANQGRVAIQRGPLVYCLEAVDNRHQRTNAIILPDTAHFTATLRNDLLGGIVIIECDALISRKTQWGETPELHDHPLKAIPYYAWANRGTGYMDVWIARSPDAATPIPAASPGSLAAVTASSPTTIHLKAVNDGRHGPTSNYRPTPHVRWPEASEKTQWIQYSWDEPQQLSRTAVYWATDLRQQVYWGKRVRGNDLVLPKSWRILYQDGDTWKPVASPEQFTLRIDQPNTVSFPTVLTPAIRLEVDMAGSPCSVQEWWVD